MVDAFGAYARYYNALYETKPYHDEANYLLDLIHDAGIREGRKLSILDLGCGTGGHAEVFAQRGHTVLGVDVSPDMIALAESRRNGVDGVTAQRMRFEVGDIRQFSSKEVFDAVLCMFHVFSYQTTNEDVAATLAVVRKRLRPGGLYLFDFWYGPGVLCDLPTPRVRHLVNGGAKITRVATPTLHPNDNVVDVKYDLLVRAEGRLVEFSETHCLRYFFKPELYHFLQSAGLVPVKFLRWMSASLPDERCWNGLIVARSQV